ncbi:hypothetical protein F511_35991 [Dorcoceras hygrometricum]|uniref:Uncharacterized protein n=1 Tax=Dorcoceras hygrometricum TaxID=472368 RepID=A0A2Z7CP94_9LAMI|nr:hypothetical protein F511_35991 [Dorcoceras hygrometricum]
MGCPGQARTILRREISHRNDVGKFAGRRPHGDGRRQHRVRRMAARRRAKRGTSSQLAPNSGAHNIHRQPFVAQPCATISNRLATMRATIAAHQPHSRATICATDCATLIATAGHHRATDCVKLTSTVRRAWRIHRQPAAQQLARDSGRVSPAMRDVARAHACAAAGGGHCGRCRQSGPRPETRVLRHPALEGLTGSARTDSPHRIGQKRISGDDGRRRRRRRQRRTAGGGGLWERGGAARTRSRVLGVVSSVVKSSTCVTLNGSGIQLAVGPQPLWLRNHNSGPAQRIMVKRLATSPHDPLDSIGYPRMSASGESSTTMHRLLHASGSHPIPTPYDPKTNQYNQDLGLIHSINGNHLESPNEGSSIDHQVTIYLHAQNITMFPTNVTWYFTSQILVSNSGGLILILTAQSTRNMFRIHSDY